MRSRQKVGPGPVQPVMKNPSFCHHCDKNRLEPYDKCFLPSGKQVCKECASCRDKVGRYRRAKVKQ
jgi:hypothetical protein